eukprot:1769940-Amphidinium_carterae.3
MMLGHCLRWSDMRTNWQLRQTDLERILQEHGLQSEAFQQVLQTSEATRSEQQSMKLLLEQHENKLTQFEANADVVDKPVTIRTAIKAATIYAAAPATAPVFA